MINQKNRKGQKCMQRTHVEVNYNIGRYKPWLYAKRHEKYFLIIWREYSPAKIKRRKANKIARKQRKKINKKNW